MKKQLFLIILISGLCFSSRISAQKNFESGFVVSSDGDTLKGQIEDRGFSKNSYSCIFRKSNKTESMVFQANDISSYGFENGDIYVSKEIMNGDIQEKRFLTLIVRGEANLYGLNDHQKKWRYFISKDTLGPTELKVKEYYDMRLRGGLNKMVLIKRKDYQGVLKYFLNDCRNLKPSFESVSLNRNNLTNIINNYNYCINPSGSEIIAQKKRGNNNLGFNVGLSYSKLKFSKNYYNKTSEYYMSREWPGTVQIHLGIYKNWSLQFIGSNTNLQVEANLTSYSSTPKIDGKKENNELVLKSTYFQTPLILQQVFPTEKMSYFVTLGVYLSPLGYLNHTYNGKKVMINKAYPGITNNKVAVVEWPKSGWIMGAGIKVPVKNRKSFMVEIRYGHSSSMSSVSSFDIRMRKFDFLIAFDLF
ncbi:MAG: hypothetical protein U5Q03_08590 [Bacteroidota bacterium]|nr:hypothetical protein [Bacteroidota bacterium]